LFSSKYSLLSVNLPSAVAADVLGDEVAEDPSVVPVVPPVVEEPVPPLPSVVPGVAEAEGLEVAAGATTSGAKGSRPVANALWIVGTLVGLAVALGVADGDAAAVRGVAWCVATGPVAVESSLEPEPRRK
jgi:hypothetical protein